MTLSGYLSERYCSWYHEVLIPLLVDDPLWAQEKYLKSVLKISLNPSFSGWPSLGFIVWFDKIMQTGLNPSFSGWPSPGSFFHTIYSYTYVLIPLLVDDPLWEKKRFAMKLLKVCLNPSFSGWPALGVSSKPQLRLLLVLIPLLVDDPLWALIEHTLRSKHSGLNPSFSGWPALG